MVHTAKLTEQTFPLIHMMRTKWMKLPDHILATN